LDTKSITGVMPNELSRRTLLTALATLPAVACGDDEAGSKVRQNGSKVLVAYFSRSGNTRVVAGLIQRSLNADLFEIQPATPYPEDYLQTVEQASRERKSNFEPSLTAIVPNIAAYDTLYLGFPIWGETAPSIIRSFLSKHDLAEKKVVPFMTHGGFGLGDSHAVLKSHAPGARLQSGFSMQADQERQTMNTVLGWLKETRAIAASAP
jgi:flavodoxin